MDLHHADGSPLQLEPWQEELVAEVRQGKYRSVLVWTGRNAGMRRFHLALAEALQQPAIPSDATPTLGANVPPARFSSFCDRDSTGRS